MIFAPFLSWLTSFLGGSIVSSLVSAYQAKLAAGNDANKIAADLAAQKAQLDLQKEQIEQTSLMSEEGRWGPFIRWGFAAPFVVFNAKAIIWDRMFHWGFTDPLSPELLCLEQVIIAAYFGHSAITIVSRVMAKNR